MQPVSGAPAPFYDADDPSIPTPRDGRWATGGQTTGAHDLPAGTFSSWLVAFRAAQHDGDGDGVAVPCGDCTACCTSSQFIHIGPDESGTISRIPKELLFPAPGLPRGHVVMGYDEHGQCPMFVDGRCSIYEQRPRTCRTYDCRVFPAAGLGLDAGDKAEIARRIERWRFDYPTEQDRRLQAAVQAATRFLRDHRRELPAGSVPGNATQLAFLAVQIHDVFLEGDEHPGAGGAIVPTLGAVEAAVRRARSARP